MIIIINLRIIHIYLKRHHEYNKKKEKSILSKKHAKTRKKQFHVRFPRMQNGDLMSFVSIISRCFRVFSIDFS